MNTINPLCDLVRAKSPADEHTAPLLGYLKSTRIEHGLLINFGSYKFQINKYALSQTTPPSGVGFMASFALILSASFALFRG